jgi:hypothetical protein
MVFVHRSISTLSRAWNTSRLFQLSTRSFSGNVEYPRIQESSLEVAKKLNTIGKILSIPTAALYFTHKKMDHIARNIESKEDLKEIQQAFLLADSKLVYPSNFAIGTFMNACVKHEVPELALEFVRQSKNFQKYMPNQTLVRLMSYYEDKDQKVVDEIWSKMTTHKFPMTYKAYAFRITNLKQLGKIQEAIEMAKKASETKDINAHTILSLVKDLKQEKVC